MRFDEPNLVSCAGLVAVMTLAGRCRLAELMDERGTLRAAGGANAPLKVPGMVAGADSIDDMDLLRHGAMTRLCTRVRVPSTLGTFLHSFTFGHVRQLDAVAATLLAHLPSGWYAVNAVWLVCATMAFNLTPPPGRSRRCFTPRRPPPPSAPN